MADETTEEAGTKSQGTAVTAAETTIADGIVGLVFVALLITLTLLVGERIVSGGWRSLWSVLATWLLLVVGALPLVLLKGTRYPVVVGCAALYGAGFGFLYGLVTHSWFSSTLFGACVGNATGYLLHHGDLLDSTAASPHKGRLAGVVAAVMLSAHMIGVIRPTSVKVPSRSAVATRGASQQEAVPGPPANANQQPAQAGDLPTVTRADQRGVIADIPKGPETARGGTPGTRLLSKEEIVALCEKSSQIELGAADDKVFSTLGQPSVVRQGGERAWHDWLVDPKDKRHYVTIGIEKGVAKSIDWSDGRLFAGEQMLSLLKKAQTLRLGESRQDVLRVMGSASSESRMVMDTVAAFDRVTHEVTRKEHKLSILTWQSAEQEERAVSVCLEGGVVEAVRIYQRGLEPVYELK